MRHPPALWALLREILVPLDATLATVAYVGVLWWNYTAHQLPVADSAGWTGAVLFTPVVFLVWLSCLHVVPLPSSRRWSPWWEELLFLGEAQLVGALVTAALALFLRDSIVQRRLVLEFPLAAWVLTAAVHLGARALLAAARRGGRNRHRILVVGARPAGLEAVARLLTAPELGLELAGQLADPGEEGLSPRLGAPEDIAQVLRQSVVDSVVVNLPFGDRRLGHVVHAAEAFGKPVRILLDGLQSRLLSARPSVVYGCPILALEPPQLTATKLLVKRLLDIAVSAVALAVLSPLFLGVAIALKAEDPDAPVLFVQERVGLHGRRFPLYKFRSMVPGAHALRAALLPRNEMRGPVFKLTDDPRVTYVGRILRRYSLDELPQFVNVLLGHMSLVGPRPPLPEEVVQYDIAHMRRLSMKPGLTCLWQVRGRSEIHDFDEWVRLDLAYIDNWSLGLDLKVILATIPAVLTGRGAK